MSGRGNGFVCRICATVTFTSVICFPTRFGASRIFLIVMFNVVTKRRYIGLCNDNRVANRAMIAFGFAFFSTCRSNCIINNFRMSERRNLLISCITTTYAFASVVCFPTRFGASRIFLIVMFNVVTKRRYIGLCNDNRVANRAMIAFGFAFFSTCRSNCIINNFRMSERRNLLISCITTTYAFASVVCFPTRFGASRIFLIVMFNVVTKRRYIGLCNDNRVANRACLPSVLPFSVHVGAIASSTTSV